MPKPTLLTITKGKAVVSNGDLRCRGPRDKDPALICNKLVVKANSLGEIAGNFRCERCRQEIEITIFHAS